MVDHLARAEELRVKAAQCQLSAKNTTSREFGHCYRLLAENYGILAKLEEEYVGRQISSQLENNFAPLNEGAR
jgi:hypothetical protein